MTEFGNTKVEEHVKISVIIPVYKVEAYLQDCIDSLLNQTFKSIEFIFVDDKSPDSCGEILDKNAAEHPDRIKVIHLPENRRQGGARNAGLAIAKGEYIGFVDSDDMVLPDMYQLLYDSVNESGSDVSFILHSVFPHNKKYRDVLTNYRNKVELVPRFQISELSLQRYNEIDRLTEADKEFLYVTHFTGGVWSALYKRQLIVDNQVYFPEKIQAAEDQYWIGLLIPYLSRIRFIDSVQYLYRNNPSSTVHRRDLVARQARVTQAYMNIDELKSRGLYDTYKNGIDYKFITLFARYTFISSINKCNAGYWKTRSFLKQTMAEFRKEFPDWRKNPYYEKLTNPKMKARDEKILSFNRGYYFSYYIKNHSVKKLRSAIARRLKAKRRG